MTPEERSMLERALKLSEDNNKILHKMQRAARWATLWAVVRVAIFIVPLVIGYLYLEPYLGQFSTLFQKAQEIIRSAP